jgi:transposase
MLKKNFKLGKNDEEYLMSFVRKFKEELRARVLLLLGKGYKNIEIAKMLDISHNTVGNIKKRYLEGGCDHALYDKPRSGQPKKYGIEEETEIIALACTNPPERYKKWTVRLIAEKLQDKKSFESITHQSVSLILKKRNKAMD